MSQKTNTVMEFNGNKYNFQTVLTISKSSPSIPVEGLEFNLPVSMPAEDAERFRVTFHGDAPAPATEVIVFKQEGKHTFLFGQELYMGGARRVRLISTPALKKARFEKEEPATAARVETSSASGSMADGMRDAFKGRSEHKRQMFDEHHKPREFTPRPQGEPYRKAQNSNLSGTPVRSGQTSHAHSTPTNQGRQNQPGYATMTNHQTPRTTESPGRTGFNREYTTGRSSGPYKKP